MDGHGGRRAVVAMGASAVALAYSWVATTGEPFTWYMRMSTAAPGLVVLAAALRRRWHEPARPQPRVRPDAAVVGALVTWSFLIGAAVWFQLALFFWHPRSVYPTLSSLMNVAFASHGVRAAGFAVWIAFAWYLLRR
jgi:hypothetical protein